MDRRDFYARWSKDGKIIAVKVHGPVVKKYGIGLYKTDHRSIWRDGWHAVDLSSGMSVAFAETLTDAYKLAQKRQQALDTIKSGQEYQRICKAFEREISAAQLQEPADKERLSTQKVNKASTCRLTTQK